MTKRKRTANGENGLTPATATSKKIKPASQSCKTPIIIQIVAGSYDRVLHGITATVTKTDAQFADTFLFPSHKTAIRCLALSPPSEKVPKQPQKIILASGSTDEQINLYHLSAHAPTKITAPVIPSLNTKPVAQNPQNRELGALVHHSRSITALYFPSRSKLLSAAEDSTIAITRTRDWQTLSTIKAPIPKVIGRPSGDTAAAGDIPTGINDFSVHPSLKLMISVGRQEKSMRLWNLVTGKKAGVLSFERGMLAEVGEGRHSSGEGRKVAWGETDAGEEFCVGFERGVLVFGMDSKPRCKVVPEPMTKIHELCYIQVGKAKDDQVLAISTEDGRIIFFSTKPADLTTPEPVEGKDTPLPAAKSIAQLGGKNAGISGRVKDFKILCLEEDFIVVTGGSDGAVRLWRIPMKDLKTHQEMAMQVGYLLGTYETENRITCLEAFVMLPPMEGAVEEEEEEFGGFPDNGEREGSSDSD